MSSELSVEKQIQVMQFERPFFEANYIACGGKLDFIKWSECSDGTGNYGVDWAAVSDANIIGAEFDDRITEHAEHVTGCLMSWVQCALTKLPPEGWILAPLEPNDMQKQAAKDNTHSEITSIHAYRTMMNVLATPLESK